MTDRIKQQQIQIIFKYYFLQFQEVTEDSGYDHVFSQDNTLNEKDKELFEDVTM